MRFGLALTGSVVFFVIALAAVFTRPVASGAATAAPEPYATADPSVTARVIPQTEHGRLPGADRPQRRAPVVRGLRLPIDGLALPDDPELLPNAERVYRAGWHEGIDFPAAAGTEVRAVAAGTILRIDQDYADWDRNSLLRALEEAVALGYTPAATLDHIRGRQVWIDHGHGVVTRYAHLASVGDLAVGDAVDAGRVIGTVGSSGYEEGGPHLHLEVRVGDDYLGDGLLGDALREAIAAAFG